MRGASTVHGILYRYCTGTRYLARAWPKLWGRVRDGLRLSSRFLLHAGRREAQKHDASLGYVRNVDAARVSQGRRYTMFDCGQTVNES